MWRIHLGVILSYVESPWDPNQTRVICTSRIVWLAEDLESLRAIWSPQRGSTGKMRCYVPRSHPVRQLGQSSAAQRQDFKSMTWGRVSTSKEGVESSGIKRKASKSGRRMRGGFRSLLVPGIHSLYLVFKKPPAKKVIVAPFCRQQ